MSGSLQLDDVAVGIADVHRGAHAAGAVAVADFAGLDAVGAQMGGDRGGIEGGQRQRDVVDVAALGAGARPAALVSAAAFGPEGVIEDEVCDTAPLRDARGLVEAPVDPEVDPALTVLLLRLRE